MVHETTIRVRYSETDAMGFLHHSSYLNYFEVARTEMFRDEGGDYKQMEDAGFYFVVVKLECRYLAPARYDDLLTIRTELIKASAVKLEHRYQVFRDDELIAEGMTLLGCVDADLKIRRIPTRKETENKLREQ